MFQRGIELSIKEGLCILLNYLYHRDNNYSLSQLLRALFRHNNKQISNVLCDVSIL